MALFDVPGWSVPAAAQPSPSSSNTKKRKRPSAAGDPGKLQTAEINMEKLMKKLTDSGSSLAKGKGRGEDKDTHSGRAGKSARAHSHKREASNSGAPKDAVPRKHERPDKKQRKHDPAASAPRDAPRQQQQRDLADSERSAKSRSQRRDKPRNEDRQNGAPQKPDLNTRDTTAHDTTARDEGATSQLTSLQAKMKQSLDGARFRWINETMYKSDSKAAERLMHEDPKIYEEYHTGFRHQVTSWPTNPVQHFIESFASYPPRSVIVDLGCGDAALGQALIPEGFNVLSYDLVAANSFVIPADICDKLPLPGGEDPGDAGQIVDAVVCCLSLMNTNWLNCIREARRVLKSGGELKIAEVASRFSNVEKFTSLISSAGFRLVSKDDGNSHFTLFDFTKSADGKRLDDKAWQKLSSKADVLQPCEYKRR